MRINNNLMAINTHRQYSVNTVSTAKSIEKLSSGLRIGRAGDDAAGLAICEKMRSQIRGMNQAARNAQDGISLIQTAEGGLGQTHSLLQRMRELSVQSASDTNTAVERSSLQLEFDQLNDEINDVANNTKFNGMNLLNVGGGTNFTAVTTLTAGIGNGVIQGSLGGVIPTDINANSVVGNNAQWIVDITNNGSFTDGGAGDMQFNDTFITYSSSFLNSFAGDIVLHAADNFSLTINDQSTPDMLAACLANGFNQLNANYGEFSPVNDFSFSATGNQLIITALNASAEYDAEGVTITPYSFGLTTASLTEPTSLYVAEQRGDYSFTIDKAIEAVGTELNIGGEIFTAVASGATGNQFNVGTDANAQAQSLVDAINANNNLNTRFTASAVGGTISLIENAGQATGSDLTTVTLSNNTAVPGEYTFDLSSSVPVGGQYTIDGVDITVTADVGDAGLADGTTVLYNGDTDAQAANLSAAINQNALLTPRYDTTASGSTITLNQNISSSMGTPIVSASSSETDGFAINLQVGANTGDDLELTIGSMTGTAIGVETLNISTRNGASAAITAIDTAVNTVSSERSKMGALQNRLSHKVSSLGTTSENLTAAESRIRDVDMAHEMMTYTKNNILVQAATAMMAQANQAPQAVLQLLQ